MRSEAKHRENKLSVGGLAGARSRDLRIKRPDNQEPFRSLFSELPYIHVACIEPRVNRLEAGCP